MHPEFMDAHISALKIGMIKFVFNHTQPLLVEKSEGNLYHAGNLFSCVSEMFPFPSPKIYCSIKQKWLYILQGYLKPL